MTVVTAKSGFDLGYVWKGQGGAAAERQQEPSGGYYIDAAQAGEAPGRWSGRGAEALGFEPGQWVEREPYEKVYRQVDPRTGEQLGRKPGGYAKYADHLGKLLAAEPHATRERLAELERQAAQATRKSPAYTDVTASIAKSVSILHASIRENARQARQLGDAEAAEWWDAREAEFSEMEQAANRAGLEHLQRWAVTRTGYHGKRVGDEEPGRYEATGLVVTSWLQGTSRDGDMQDHIHNQIARMSLTARDGVWRAVDTMALRAQLPAVQAIVSAHLEADLVRRFGVTLSARPDGIGNEIEGISRAQIEAYSTRTQTIDRATPAAVEAWTRKHGRAPNRRELLYIRKEVTVATREGKEEGAIDWDALAASWGAKWDASEGSTLAQVAPAVSNLRGPGGDASREPKLGGPAPIMDAQHRAMRRALARVQTAQSTWTRADLMRAMATVLPAEAYAMTPEDLVALVHDLTDRAIAGEVEQVLCLDAPEWPPLPDHLRRDLDGRSIYTRPGTSRYATEVQLSREERLVTTAGATTAPRLDEDESAALLGSTAEDLAAAGRARAQDASGRLANGLRMDQAAAVHAGLTSPRTVYTIVGPAGSGKTHVLAQAARMWPGPVVGLAPSQAARNVLAGAAQIEAYNTAKFLGHHETKGRGFYGPREIQPGTLLMLDEGSMTSTEDIRDLAELAARYGAKLLIAGDHGQLTAVEGGGGMALLAREYEHAQLAEPVRFAADWEREASLRLRAGDAEVLTEYDQHGRISGGTADEALDGARKSYLAAYLDGRDVLLMAHSHETTLELSRRIRDDLQHLGVVSRGPEAPLKDGAAASVGDLVITRKNNHDLGVANGDTWRVEAINGDELVLRKLLDADRDTGQRQYAASTVTYRDGKRNADLAYAITGHSAQGRTVAEAAALITGTETREWAYVAMTRAVNRNTVYAVTDPARAAEPEPGTRSAPELDWYEKLGREREAWPDPELFRVRERDHEAREPIAVLSDVLANEGAELSALEVQRRNLANADHLGKLHAIWQDQTAEAITGRYERLLREHLPAEYQDAQLSGHATWLWRTLRSAEAAGQDASDVLARAIGSGPLTGSRDVAAVIDARIREQTGSLVPEAPGSWASRVPDIEDPERREYVAQLAEAMDARADRLGEHTAGQQPVWAVRALGPVPEDPVDRLDWEGRASKVAAYRETFGYSHLFEPIGPEPVNSPEARAAWHEAFAALGPVDGVDLRGVPDGRLLNMRATYEAETAWAPRYVGDELRQVRLGEHEARQTASLATAQARAARARGEAEAAGRHEAHARSAQVTEGIFGGLIGKLTETMEARAEWEKTTEQGRHLAVAAHSEYMRRHPDAELEPLRSAEPPQPDETEREALQPEPERTEHETPQWVAELAERNQATMAKIDERRGLRVPSEDHEWEDEGLAWPDEVRRERDAVIQPPKPEIKPAEPVAQAAAAQAKAREAGD
ncbi:MAG TPA: MobF family relaxase [Streptosporangiaceae bacterium]|nr:MobF family relaxase [Streptosporangiaceae bacterium]